MRAILCVSDVFGDLNVLQCRLMPTLSNFGGEKPEVGVISARRREAQPQQRTCNLYYNECSRHQNCRRSVAFAAFSQWKRLCSG